ncbi:MAG TPA: MFS transporter [Aggregatilineales bacterium]|nr:MFS transporter [Aggregatilineales bacterium]
MNIPRLGTAQRDVWLIRLYYLLYYGGVGCMSPFLNLFYTQIGLTGTQIGWTVSIMALVTLVAAPLWANQNAEWRNPRVALQLFLIAVALGYLVLSQQTFFVGVAIVSLVRALVGAGVTPISDSLALTVTRAAQKGYGSVRVWGSLGWILLVPLSGWLVERTGLRTSLISAFAVTLLSAAILLPVSRDSFTPREVQDKPRITSVVGKLLHNRAMVGAALMLVFIGIGNSGVAQFENVYLRQLGASDSLIGILATVNALLELPCMLWADRRATRRGAYGLMLGSMLLYLGLRVMVLLAPSILAITLARSLTGFAFSFFTVGLVRFVGEQTPARETGTVLALYSVTLANLISILSSPLSGAAFDAFGGRPLYAIAAIGYVLAWASLLLARRHDRQQARWPE